MGLVCGGLVGLGCVICGFNTKFISKRYRGGGNGTYTTPSYFLYKNTVGFRECIEWNVRRCLFCVVWF